MHTAVPLNFHVLCTCHAPCFCRTLVIFAMIQVFGFLLRGQPVPLRVLFSKEIFEVLRVGFVAMLSAFVLVCVRSVPDGRGTVLATWYCTNAVRVDALRSVSKPSAGSLWSFVCRCGNSYTPIKHSIQFSLLNIEYTSRALQPHAPMFNTKCHCSTSSDDTHQKTSMHYV